MMLTLLIMLTSITAFSMFLAMNPLTIGILILMMALLLSMTFAYAMSSWLALLLFLIYIGGMLVMFSYFVSIMPNQTIAFQFIISSIFLSMISMSMIIQFMNISPTMTTIINNQLNFMYLKMNSPMLMTLALILLFTMIVVVKLTTLSKGPLRPFMS